MLRQPKSPEPSASASANVPSTCGFRPTEAAGAENSKGLAYLHQGKLNEAAGRFREALRLQPNFPDAHYHLGYALFRLGKLDGAIAAYRQATRLRPDFVEALNNLSIALRHQTRAAEAEPVCREAVRLRPNSPEVHINLGMALLDLGRSEEALASLRHARDLQPESAQAHNHLGIALRRLVRPEEAVVSLREALRLQPDFVDALNSLGISLYKLGLLEEATERLAHALSLKPDHVEARLNLGNVLRDQGRLDDALAAYRTALGLRPEAADIHSTLVFSLHYHPGYDAPAILAEARRWNGRHAEPLRASIQPHANSADPERRLRVGYVSLDFCNHVNAFFMISLLANHDHRQCEVYCYAHVVRPDGVTDRFRGCADVWRNTVGLSDAQLAELVRRDQIDILVDLGMHTGGSRLLAFARKPAPVQVSWVAYPGTTGLSAIDYRLTDPYLDPPGLLDACYAEESIRLADTFWCYDPLTEPVPIGPLPALQSGHVTFGCLNNFCKINDGVLSLWAQVLGAVPGSRLLLLAPRGHAREWALAGLQQGGVAPERVEFADKEPRRQYLELYHQIDLSLDPFPYNGHTTSLDGFWMGVPIVTLVGRTVVGRAGWSQLCNLGLQELAAQTPEAYVALVTQLAGDLPRLQELRGTLRERTERSPLMDGPRFARQVEQAYRQMWQRWCSSRVVT
jgi:predicted O-linked N-acetylglucosamine transferase (SPINDLY family)